MKITNTIKVCLLFTLLVGNLYAAHAQTDFEQRLTDMNISHDNTEDLSENAKITIATPDCAYVNITGVTSMPWSKTDPNSIDMRAVMEVYDMNGNFFKKRILLNAQGNSSMGHEKKNFSVDFCEDEWEGDKTTKITIGDWVPQDAFHFKAYYLDGFRGISNVAYKLFDQSVADHESYLARAGEKDTGARCYPDGFPCVVYHNGEFYGVFAWNLKKHRDNMGLDKKKATHIQLDGTLRNECIWNGNVEWTQFEIRNPKSLYSAETTEDGSSLKKYDGDHPTELIDESMPNYDATDKNHVATAQVKHSIENLSKYCDKLKALEEQNVSTEEMRAAFEERFDIKAMIDYVVFADVVNNYDGFGKNWQWVTWDGKKWTVCPYDLDGTFGNIWTGYCIFPAEWNYFAEKFNSLSYSTTGPMYFVSKFYYNEIENRYKELRDKGVFTTDNIMSLLRKWHAAIGSDIYELEWEKWKDSPCIGETIANDNWLLINDWTGYNHLTEYDAAQTYNEGDRCQYKQMIWEATATTTGVAPCSKTGFTESLERAEEWISRRLEIADKMANYCPTAIDRINQDCKCKAAAIYSIDGIKRLRLAEGINIVRMTDGSTHKVYNKTKDR